jgi:hypothetical protein
MYIHKLNKTTLGGRSVFGHRKNRSGMKIAGHHKRTMGAGLKPEIFEDGQVKRASEVLRNIKMKPKVPRKYISFE